MMRCAGTRRSAAQLAPEQPRDTERQRQARADLAPNPCKVSRRKWDLCSASNWMRTLSGSSGRRCATFSGHSTMAIARSHELRPAEDRELSVRRLSGKSCANHRSARCHRPASR